MSLEKIAVATAVEAGVDSLPSSTHADPVEPFSLLLVDDEPNILNALRRLLRTPGYRIHSAGSGAEGLALLERETVDLVISDMRMPEMNGAEFLDRVRSRWPDTVRVLLTGYADMASTVDAINRGEIFRYVSKPWDEAHLLGVVEQGLERKALEREKRRLEALTRKQNAELAELNRTLESKVEQRTAELKAAHAKLRTGFLNSIRVFSNMLELRAGTMAGHSRRVAEHVRAIAQRLEVPAEAAHEMLFAALLHDIGKIGLPDKILDRAVSQYTAEERHEYAKHPMKGEALLMAMDPLQGAARIIRSHHERFDGSGYPDGVAGLEISLGARILAVADDYDELICGHLQQKRYSATAAYEQIQRGRGRGYDPAVVDAFLALLVRSTAVTPPPERKIETDELEPGMVLARDLLSRDGMLLLSREHAFDAALIKQIRAFQRTEGSQLTVFIKI